MHLDGARIFNAAVALETEAAELVRHSDTVTFCLSKGLGCPVGSVLCGPQELIDQARVYRKMLGGGMRQAGILAAAGVYALEHNVERLTDDHAHALELSKAIEKYDAFRPRHPQTNILIVDILKGSLGEWLAAFQREGVLAVPFGHQRMRLVTHINITSEDVRAAIEGIDRAVEAVAP
ncbi:MAG: beta-eliminating lyase-related protein [Dehalococcoidia bacterium]|nr:beta-eliminating lyase-related protein [Dehalococcoidia bacterium]